MTIIDKIKKTVENAGYTFMYGGLDELNESISRHDFDTGKLFYVTLIDGGQIVNENGVLYDISNFALYVCDKTDFDPISEENERIIDECRRVLFAWLLSVKNNPDFRISNYSQARRVYDAFDTIVTGYAVEMSVRNLEGVSICYNGK